MNIWTQYKHGASFEDLVKDHGIKKVKRLLNVINKKMIRGWPKYKKICLKN